jgi:DNA-binding GntR family transcriptional regulator
MSTPRSKQRLSVPLPRYASLAEALIGDIGRGRYAVGSLLPTEAELQQQYGVSRHTLREATRRLVDMGLISRHPGIGTRVRAKTAEANYVASLTSIADLFQYTHETRLELLGEATVIAQGTLARLLRCEPGQHWFMLRTCRYPLRGAEPISYTEIYVQPQYRGIRKFFGSNKSITIYNLIEEQYGERIVEVQQDVSAVAISAAEARLLRTRARMPGLRILRYYLGTNDRLLSMSINTYPADRFSFSTRWRLEWGKAPNDQDS